MNDSNFWYYVAGIVIIGHFLAGFMYLLWKMNPTKGKSKTKKSQYDL